LSGALHGWQSLSQAQDTVLLWIFPFYRIFMDDKRDQKIGTGNTDHKTDQRDDRKKSIAPPVSEYKF
jgi:hypothetical protein